MIDAIVQRTDLRNLLSAYLDLLGPQYRLTPRDKRRPEKFEVQGNEAWSSVQLARHHQRPSTIDYIARIFTSFVELHGDRAHGDDPSMICGFGHLGGQTVVVLGHDRGSDDGPDNDGRMSPEGFRKAQRAIRLAAKFDFPLLSLIDTPGPDTTLAAEERGLGNAIATTMAEIAGIAVPSIAVVIGEGGSAAALALGVTDRVLMMENAIYSAVSPEEAAEMMFQDPSKAEEAAESLRLTAQDCRELGIADRLIPEPPEGAHTNPDDAARQLRRVLVEELADLQSKSQRRRLRRQIQEVPEDGRVQLPLQGGDQTRGGRPSGLRDHRSKARRPPRPCRTGGRCRRPADRRPGPPRRQQRLPPFLVAPRGIGSSIRYHAPPHAAEGQAYR